MMEGNYITATWKDMLHGNSRTCNHVSVNFDGVSCSPRLQVDKHSYSTTKCNAFGHFRCILCCQTRRKHEFISKLPPNLAFACSTNISGVFCIA